MRKNLSTLILMILAIIPAVIAKSDSARVVRGDVSLSAYATEEGGSELYITIAEEFPEKEGRKELDSPRVAAVLVQSEEPWLLGDYELPAAQVILKRASASIISGSEDMAFDFFVPDEEETRATAKARVKEEAITIWEGFGLSLIYESDVFQPKIRPVPCQVSSVCDSGGVGATKCDISCTDGGVRQCSTTCRSEYSACCECIATGACCRCVPL